MKKFAVMMLAVLMMTMVFVPNVFADDGFAVNDIVYEGHELHCDLTVPCDDYFVRVTMFIGDQYIVFCAPIQNGAYHAHIAASCDYITVAIVDRIDAFVPGSFHVYAAGDKTL